MACNVNEIERRTATPYADLFAYLPPSQPSQLVHTYIGGPYRRSVCFLKQFTFWKDPTYGTFAWYYLPGYTEHSSSARTVLKYLNELEEVDAEFGSRRFGGRMPASSITYTKPESLTVVGDNKLIYIHNGGKAEIAAIKDFDFQLIFTLPGGKITYLGDNRIFLYVPGQNIARFSVNNGTSFHQMPPLPGPIQSAIALGKGAVGILCNGNFYYSLDVTQGRWARSGTLSLSKIIYAGDELNPALPGLYGR